MQNEGSVQKSCDGKGISKKRGFVVFSAFSLLIAVIVIAERGAISCLYLIFFFVEKGSDIYCLIACQQFFEVNHCA